MNVKNKQGTVTVTAAVNEKEKNLFTEIAREIDVPHNILVRRLIRFFLDEKIAWNELFRQHDDLSVAYRLKGSEKRDKRLRTQVEPEQYATFTRRVEELGSTTGIVLRRLISLYVAGKIERRDIW